MTETGGASRRSGGAAFVGRDREMAELAAGLEDAIGGRGRLFLVAGEPGIGKTGLAEQLAGHASERGARALWGRCWEGGGAPPYWPWAQVVRALAEGSDDEALTSYLGAGAASAARLVPGLAERLGGTAAPVGPSLESEAARFYLFEATAGFLKKAAADQPLVLVLEDLHAADEPSLLLLTYLARDLRDSRLLVLGTFRDVEAGPPPGIGDVAGELVRDGQLIALRGLVREDVKGLIRGLVGIVPSQAKVAAIHETTEGNPLFVREAVRLLASQGALDRPGRLVVPIPGTVRALIRQRLAPLSADAIQALSAAAVVGRAFDLSLVGPVCGLPFERVLGALSEAVMLGVVAEEAGAAGRYRFSHSLMREVTYEALPIPARIGLHRQVGEAIERLHAADLDPHVAELARHFAEVAAAGEAARALGYARRAGERAMETHAYEEAAAEYERALDALPFAGPDEALRCELLLRLGAARVRAGRYPEAKESHLQAAEISRTLGVPEQLARAALGFGEPQVEGGLVNRQLVALLNEALDALGPDDSPLRVRLLARLSVELTFSDEAELIESLSRQAVEMARRLGHVATLGAALDARWMAVWGPDGLDERSALADETLHLAQETGDRELELVGRAQRAAGALESGDFRTVEADIAAYARLADEFRMPVRQWTETSMRAMRALLQGSFEEAERLAGEGLALQPERLNVRWAHLNQVALLRWQQGRLGELRETWQTLVERFPGAGFARGWLALADAEGGNGDDARRGLWPVVEHVLQHRRNGLWLPAFALASLVSAHLDDAEAAGRLYPVALPYANHVIAMTMEQPVVCFGSASLYLGLLATIASRWVEAEEHFDAALWTHDRLGATPFVACTQYEYARMLVRRGRDGDRSRALELLDRVAATARAIGMARIVAEIDSLREVEPPRPPSVNLAAEATAAPEPAGTDLFRREGEYWTVSYDGSVVRLKDSKGLRHLARLLANPGRELHVTDLESADGESASTGASRPGGRAAIGELELRPDLGDAGALLDAEAKAAYKARLDELQSELDEAQAFNDFARAEKAQQERDFLVGELARAVGLGGRDRRAASHAERARLNVTRAIRAAMVSLARAHPSLGRHLDATIRTGRYCSYTPDPRTPVAWQL
jgi:tetratricopeptide (TPR) repeat protein